MEIEVRGLLDSLSTYEETTIDNNKAYTFTLKDEDYVLIQGYIGKANTAFLLGRLSVLLNIKRVFNIGTSGGVNSNLKINDVVIATRVGYHDVDVTKFGYEYGQIPDSPRYFECDNEFINAHPIDPKYSIKRGEILSGDIFIHKDNLDKYTIKENCCMCCEMEAATVGQICTRLHIPFVIVRSISDLVFEHIDMTLDSSNVKSSSTNSALILLELIK